MEKISTKVKKWGNSFGIILPKNIVNTENIREGLEIDVIIQSKNKMTVGDIFQLSRKHKLPKLKKSTEELIREVDNELWPE